MLFYIPKKDYGQFYAAAQTIYWKEVGLPKFRLSIDDRYKARKEHPGSNIYMPKKYNSLWIRVKLRYFFKILKPRAILV